ncbi:MAG: NADH-quinone oxidoreductase subunit N, partial [Stackebrandtia sp.]
FLVVSVAAGAVTLFGAGLLYAAAGTVHLSALPEALEGVPAQAGPLTATGAAMIVAGLAFKVAAVPLHAWAPGVYDRAPLPIAAYLSTASKLGGAAALLWVATIGLTPLLHVVGPILAAIAAATMTVGNLGALRQTRAVRLLAWSSIAQAGYLLAPLGAFAVVAGREPAAVDTATAAVLAFAAFYVILELTAFASVVGLRGGAADGGPLEDYRGSLRRAPLLSLALILALIGLAGLPPGLAGLFAKITIMSALADAVPWLGVIVAVNAVIGLVYYLKFTLVVIDTRWTSQTATDEPARPWPVAATVAAGAIVLVVLGFTPQYVVDVIFQ